jgi:hypothetical protein
LRYSVKTSNSESFALEPESQERFDGKGLLDRLQHVLVGELEEAGYHVEPSAVDGGFVLTYKAADIDGRIEITGALQRGFYTVQCKGSEEAGVPS